MKCAWKELLSILPAGLSEDVAAHEKDTPQELRLRLDEAPELVCAEGSVRLKTKVRKDDLNFCINTASRYSPWSAASTAHGYLTAPGGHRIGICGDAVVKENQLSGIRRITSLCIRIARDYPGIAETCCGLNGSVLLIGPPGSGKTTLLRDLIRQISLREHVAVVDQRGELFPDHFDRGFMTDVMTGCPKREGIEIMLRTMGPECIAMDEITAEGDCQALLRAAWCGVRLLATAHAGSIRDLKTRPLYRPVLEYGVFDHILVLSRDKTWREERIYPC